MSGADNEIGLRAGAVPTTAPLRGTAADDRQGSGGDRQTLQIITLFEAAIDNRAEGNALLRRLVELVGEMNFRLTRIEVALVSKETAPENIVRFLRPVPHEGKVR